MLSPVETKMQRARIALLLDEPFFGTLLLGLRQREDKAGEVTKTMATDGESLWWHTPFVESLDAGEIKTVLAHEVMHCACLHQLRRGDRKPGAWNAACDHAVNLELEACNDASRAAGKAAPFAWPKPPNNPLMDPAHKDKCAEEIYVAPAENQDGQGGDGDSSSGPGDSQGMGGVLDAPGEQKDEQEAGWKCALVQAAAAAKAQGKLPASMARLIQDIVNPSVPWQELLRQFVRAACKDDYSWMRPNPRYLATGFMVPSLHSQRLGRIAVAVDTSGSIDSGQLDAFMREIEGIAAECRPETITVIDCDAQVHSMRDYSTEDTLPRDFTGGGGTSHTPVMAALENDPPDCLICFTDLETTFPDDPGYPVIWATNGDLTAPFGQTIKL